MGVGAFLGRILGRDGAIDSRAARAVALCRALLGERGEASGAALAREALAACGELDAAAREQFFDVLAHEFSPAPEAVGQAADRYRDDPTPANLVRLQKVAESARQELFRRLNMAPGGTAALVEMRRALLRGLEARPQWRALDADLLHLLRSWFNRGFLKLERIDWRTPALVLEKLIRYEAVHAIQGWDDLRRRLQADRRCFAFFHPQLPEEPLIFIEVALTREMSAAVQPLLDVASPVQNPAEARFAMFYSISNCQDGLRGISFGNFLIKQVAEELRRELPRVRKFATLSPIPGFREWLDGARVRLAVGEQGEQRLGLLARLEHADWHRSAQTPALERLLMPLCAHYLLRAKRGAEPRDAVSRFHLGNGASLERLNWLGDTSASGMQRSAGMMVNYLYRLARVERNHELFVKEHRIAASREIERLARECPLAAAPGPVEAGT
jgi:malonyl-CoA decarboxylase